MVGLLLLVLLLLLLLLLLMLLVGMVDGIVVGQVVQLLHKTRRAAAGLALDRLVVVRSAAKTEVGHHVGQALEQFAGRALLTTARRLTDATVSTTISPLVRIASLPRLHRRHLETPDIPRLDVKDSGQTTLTNSHEDSKEETSSRS